MFSGLLNGAWQNGVITYFANCKRGMTGFLMSFPNSIGYISLSYATDASITYAKVENKAGYFVLPNISTVQQSIDFYLNTTTSLVFPLIDSPTPMSYPISLFTYFIFHSDNVDNCYSMAEFVSYIRWIYNKEDAVEMCSTSGFVPLSERLIRDVETKIIKDLTCGGHTIVKLLENQKVVYREESGTLSISVSVIVIVLTCSLVSVLFLTFIQWRRNKNLNKNSWRIDIQDITFYFDEMLRRKTNSDDSFDLYINEEDNVDLDKIIQWPGKWKCHTIGLRLEELKKMNDFKQDQQRAILSMQDVIHSNVLRFYGLTELDGITYVISDYCSKGSLFDIIHDFRFNFSLHFNISLAVDIASGMNFLHSQNIIHGNLNSFCCLIDLRWTVKISDWEYTKMQCAFQKVNEKKKSGGKRKKGYNGTEKCLRQFLGCTRIVEMYNERFFNRIRCI